MHREGSANLELGERLVEPGQGALNAGNPQPDPPGLIARLLKKGGLKVAGQLLLVVALLAGSYFIGMSSMRGEMDKVKASVSQAQTAALAAQTAANVASTTTSGLTSQLDILNTKFKAINDQIKQVEAAEVLINKTYPEMLKIETELKSYDVSEIPNLRRDMDSNASSLHALQTTRRVEQSSELKMFFADTCPPGWIESNVTKGYALVGRPSGSTSGTKLNDPMGAGETSRVGPHTHLAAVTDPGHTHTSPITVRVL